ncbi:MAG: tRNA-intron lyase [DPANN group archaeon]|nr:tRNA-intron lyase [DPANN group archaeon]
MDNNSDVMATAELLNNKLAVWDIEEQKKIFDEKFFGKYIEEEKISYLQLSLEEGMILLERGHIKVLDKKKPMTVKTFYSLCSTLDPEFSQKYTVYRDLRNRGFIVKSGFKFGTHFRVYNRGVNPYKGGSKELKEHTKYNVHAVPENYAHSYQEWSRYVRLSQNIRAKALLAVVDEEADVTYYVITRIRP